MVASIDQIRGISVFKDDKNAWQSHPASYPRILRSFLEEKYYSTIDMID